MLPGDLVLAQCVSARRVVLAAPYIKLRALRRLLEAISPGACVTCIARWTPHDLISGASDTECREAVIRRGGSFRLHPSLHAKFYLFDDKALVGSANVTLAALGWAVPSNLEILCRPGDDFCVSSFLDRLLDGSREISDGEFRHWEAIGRLADSESVESTMSSSLEMWRPATRDLRHIHLAYDGRVEDIASFDEQCAARRDIQALMIPKGFTENQVRAWISVSLLAAPFTDAVLRVKRMDRYNGTRWIAAAYNIGITDARRDIETVQNWLAVLAPEKLRG